MMVSKGKNMNSLLNNSILGKSGERAAAVKAVHNPVAFQILIHKRLNLLIILKFCFGFICQNMLEMIKVIKRDSSFFT